MKSIETHPREKGFVLWGYCQNILDDPRKCSCFDSDTLLRFTKMVKCLPEFEYFYCVLEK